MRAQLELAGITKAYPLVLANDHIDLKVMPGEIHAVLGENGAGKSTLMKIIYGVTRPDSGTVLWEDREVEIRSPQQARKLGIGMVFQHFALFETLTVAENISLALNEKAAPAKLAARISSVSQAYGLSIDPLQPIHSMSVGERQRVEIVRCLLQNPRLLIMDEPTSVLTPQAVQTLFDSLRRLASEGCSILYISHKLDEIQSLCDTATVLRAGRVTGTAIPRQESTHSLAEMMIGHDLPACTLTPRQPGELPQAMRELSAPGADPVGTGRERSNMGVASGEIVGIAGISGNGQMELLKVISGELACSRANMIELVGQPAGLMGAAQRRQAGLCFVPEERLGRGAVPDMSLLLNSLLTGYAATDDLGMVRRGWVGSAAVRAFTRRVIERFDVRGGNEHSQAGSLSGGNLQKFIVGREMLLAPKVMVLAQPTWGVDIGASMLIRQAIIDLRNQGVAVLVISEELSELFMICDRIAVIASGRLSPSVPIGQTDVRQIGAWMSGDFGASDTDAAEPVAPEPSGSRWMEVHNATS